MNRLKYRPLSLKEKIDDGLSTQVPADLSEDGWKAKAEEIQDDKDREAFKKYWTQYQGGASELYVWQYLSRLPESGIGIFHNFDLHNKYTDQEPPSHIIASNKYSFVL